MATFSTAGTPFSTGGEAVVNFGSLAVDIADAPDLNFLAVKVRTYASGA